MCKREASATGPRIGWNLSSYRMENAKNPQKTALYNGQYAPASGHRGPVTTSVGPPPKWVEGGGARDTHDTPRLGLVLVSRGLGRGTSRTHRCVALGRAHEFQGD